MNRKKLIKTEVCHLFNTTKEFLRHYENKLLLHPESNESNYRLYGYEDIQKIREILLLRKLDFPIKDMQKLYNKEFSKHTFNQSLKERHNSLTKKIEKLVETQNDIVQLLELLDTDETISFLEKNYNERYFILTDSLQNQEDLTLKAYYDRYKNIIEDESYSERVFQMIYDYNGLSNENDMIGKVAVEIDRKSDLSYTLASGTYISVFFPFEHGNFKDLMSVKNSIEAYLKIHNLKRVDDTVLEQEHPELSMFVEDSITIFELQIRVERIN